MMDFKGRKVISSPLFRIPFLVGSVPQIFCIEDLHCLELPHQLLLRQHLPAAPAKADVAGTPGNNSNAQTNCSAD